MPSGRPKPSLILMENMRRARWAHFPASERGAPPSKEAPGIDDIQHALIDARCCPCHSCFQFNTVSLTRGYISSSGCEKIGVVTHRPGPATGFGENSVDWALNPYKIFFRDTWSTTAPWRCIPLRRCGAGTGGATDPNGWTKYIHMPIPSDQMVSQPPPRFSTVLAKLT